MKIKSYTELKRLKTFNERYKYLKLDGSVGHITFGFDRYLNQKLYTSRQWQDVRDYVITRDLGCDLGIEGYDIYDRIIVHHMNPITIEDVEQKDPKVFDPEYLICTTHRTHQAIHYGDENLLTKPMVIRRIDDTSPWRQKK